MRRALHATLVGLALAALLAAGAGLWLRGRLVAGLPLLDGERVLSGLRGMVSVERDARGVPVIRGASRLDVARATGFVHAQERFFQMDLLRRRAAGELAELFGMPALEADREIRPHRFRAVARRVLERADADERELLAAYAGGTNAGLAALGERPFEYLLLRVAPSAWLPEDTVLASLAMWITLQDESGRRESALGVMHDVLPRELVAFLAPPGTEWDAPVVGQAFVQPVPPSPEVFDLRGRRTPHAARLQPPAPTASPWLALPGWRQLERGGDDAAALGSNSWAVAGQHTAHAGALLANDMHLGIGVPNTWYRVSLVWSEAGEERRMTGVTLPGTPAVVVGSNGFVAWGFTNSYGDWSDLVEIEPVPGAADAYRTPDGPRRFERVRETIRIRGARDQTLDVVETIWGPVIDRDHRGRRRALRWAAHDAEAVNLRLFRLEAARGLEQALELAAGSGTPHQNFVCASRDGRIGWTIMGRIPRRVGFDGQRPGSWADGTRRWDGWLASEQQPRIVDPPGGRLWTANARVVDGERLALLGDGGYDLGARARQIRDDLLALGRADEGQLLGVQLDDRALFLARWRELLLATLTPRALHGAPLRAEFRRLVQDWGGRATVDSVGYRLVRAFRSELRERALGPLTAACQEADPRFEFRRVGFQWEGPLWALLRERPVHLLSANSASWEELLLVAVDATIASLLREGGALAERSWGERNTPRITHPLARALPGLGWLLDMPRRPIPGDGNMPRVQNLDEGASQRMVVSPGREADGVFHMPCGQSGHPLSPHYGDGHEDWLAGRPAPFLPGPAVHTLTLHPAAGQPAL